MKTIKKSKYILLALMITLSVIIAGCSNDKKKATASVKTNKFCMWEVTSKDSKGKLYLFGSVHMADESIYPLPSKIINAFDESDCLAVEADSDNYNPDDKKQQEMQYNLEYHDGTKIYDHIDKDTYENCKKILTEYKQYQPSLDNMKPAVWYSILNDIAAKKSPLTGDYGLDDYFMTKAKSDKKPVIDLEGVEFQQTLLPSFSDGLMNLLLKDYTPESFDEMSLSSNDETYEAWKAGDIDKVYRLSFGDTYEKASASDKKLWDEYWKIMLTDRNNVMVEKAEQILKDNKKCFYVVGDLHMLGKDGIVQQLKDKGYTVKRI